MAKEIVTESRFDFRGGRNTSTSSDLLNKNELVDTTNVRLVGSYGAFTKRTGSQRIHASAIGSGNPIRGITQWDGPSGKQVVAICNGHLFYRNGFTYATAFTDEGTNVFSTSLPAFFMPFRDSSSGAPLVLFIASDGKLFKWTGSVLTDITAGTTAADRVIAYHTRAFARNKNFKKHLFWSKVGDATTFTTGSKTDGGSAMVDVLNGEELVAFEVIGSSLLLAAEDSIMRFTGHATDDIVIAQDTEGVSSEVGAVGPLALRRFENVAGVLSDRGPYAVTESEVVPIGEQIIPDFDSLDTALLANSIVQFNRGRKDLLFIVPRSGDNGNKSIFAQSVRLQSWQGPWTYSFSTVSSCRYEDVNSDENWLSGGADGFIRLMDVGQLDDVLSDGTGGSNITMTAELPILHFGNAGTTKALNYMKLQAELPSGSDLRVKVSFDGDSFTEGSFINAVLDGTERDYRLDFEEQGKRLRMQFVDASSKSPVIHGFNFFAYDYGRV